MMVKSSKLVPLLPEMVGHRMMKNEKRQNIRRPKTTMSVDISR
jgi:hypothetical protein